MIRTAKNEGYEVTTTQKGDHARITVTLDAETAKRLAYALATAGDDARMVGIQDGLAEAFGGWSAYNAWIDDYETKLLSAENTLRREYI